MANNDDYCQTTTIHRLQTYEAGNKLELVNTQHILDLSNSDDNSSSSGSGSDVDEIEFIPDVTGRVYLEADGQMFLDDEVNYENCDVDTRTTTNGNSSSTSSHSSTSSDSDTTDSGASDVNRGGKILNSVEFRPDPNCPRNYDSVYHQQRHIPYPPRLKKKKYFKPYDGFRTYSNGFYKILFAKTHELMVMRIPKNQLNIPFGIQNVVKRTEGDLTHLSLQNIVDIEASYEFRLNPNGKFVDLVVTDTVLYGSDAANWDKAYKDGVHKSWYQTFKPVIKSNNYFYIDITAFLKCHILRLLQQTIAFNENNLSGISFQYKKVKSYTDVFEIDMDVKYRSQESGSVYARSAVLRGRRFAILGFSLDHRVSIFKYPDTPIVGRMADKRVGYFGRALINSDCSGTLPDGPNFQIARWDFTDPAKLPLKIYIDPSCPAVLRQTVKDGLEYWNAAFNAIGYTNPIRGVLPTDPDWPAEYDPADFRYNVIVLGLSNWGPWGFGPSVTDLRSGEILNTKLWVGLDITYQTVNREARLFNPPCSEPCGLPGLITPEELFDVVAHELGHGLGIRHNFISSSDPTINHQSVMDYDSAIDSTDPFNWQRAVINTTMSDADAYTIKYGYTPLVGEVTGVKHPELDVLANGYNVGDAPNQPPNNPFFASDSDRALFDPRTNVFDAGPDNITWAEGIIDGVINHATTLLNNFNSGALSSREFYLTTASSLTNLAVRASLTILTNIGGMYQSRDRTKFEIVPTTELVRALSVLMKFYQLSWSPLYSNDILDNYLLDHRAVPGFGNIEGVVFNYNIYLDPYVVRDNEVNTTILSARQNILFFTFDTFSWTIQHDISIAQQTESGLLPPFPPGAADANLWNIINSIMFSPPTSFFTPFEGFFPGVGLLVTGAPQIFWEPLFTLTPLQRELHIQLIYSMLNTLGNTASQAELWAYNAAGDILVQGVQSALGLISGSLSTDDLAHWTEVINLGFILSVLRFSTFGVLTRLQDVGTLFTEDPYRLKTRRLRLPFSSNPFMKTTEFNTAYQHIQTLT